MKTLNELYTEITASEALKNEFLNLKTPEEAEAFAKKNGCDATFDEMRTFFKEKQQPSGELSEDDLELATGGSSALSACLLFVGCLITDKYSKTEVFSACKAK